MREEKYMDYDIEMNKKDYQREKEARAKRLEAYAEAIQTITLQKSSKVIEELIEERRRQGLTQQDLGGGGHHRNFAFESGAAGEQKKGSNTGRAAKIRFGVRNAH